MHLVNKLLGYLLIASLIGCSGGESENTNSETDSSGSKNGSTNNGSNSGTTNVSNAAPDKLTEATLTAKMPNIEIETFERKTPGSYEEAKQVLEEIRKTMDVITFPKPLAGPFEEDVCNSYVQKIVFLTRQQKVDLEWLQNFKPADIAGIDEPRANQLATTAQNHAKRIESFVPQQLTNNVSKSVANLQLNITDILRDIRFGAEIDDSDPNKLANVLLDPKEVMRREEQIYRFDFLVPIAMLLNEHLDTELEVSNWITERNDLVGKFRAKVNGAVSKVTLPKAIDKPDLLKIAEEVLTSEKYGVPGVERTLVVTDIQNKTRTEYFFYTGSVERVDSKWKQFQVATVEKEGDGYALWYNMMAYYEKGPNSLPMNKWILKIRFRSCPITKEAALK